MSVCYVAKGSLFPTEGYPLHSPAPIPIQAFSLNLLRNDNLIRIFVQQLPPPLHTPLPIWTSLPLTLRQIPFRRSYIPVNPHPRLLRLRLKYLLRQHPGINLHLRRRVKLHMHLHTIPRLQLLYLCLHRPVLQMVHRARMRRVLVLNNPKEHPVRLQIRRDISPHPPQHLTTLRIVQQPHPNHQIEPFRLELRRQVVQRRRAVRHMQLERLAALRRAADFDHLRRDVDADEVRSAELARFAQPDARAASEVEDARGFEVRELGERGVEGRPEDLHGGEVPDDVVVRGDFVVHLGWVQGGGGGGHGRCWVWGFEYWVGGRRE